MELQLIEDRPPVNQTAPPTSADERAWLASLRDELDTYYAELQRFATDDPGDALATISSVHARLVEVRAHLQRSMSQRANALRTKEVDPLMEALEFQFKCLSRSIALTEQEWNIARGAN